MLVYCAVYSEVLADKDETSMASLSPTSPQSQLAEYQRSLIVFVMLSIIVVVFSLQYCKSVISHSHNGQIEVSGNMACVLTCHITPPMKELLLRRCL